jgi:hypothetical protein
MPTCQFESLPTRAFAQPTQRRPHPRPPCSEPARLRVRVVHHLDVDLCAKHAVHWINEAWRWDEELLELRVLPKFGNAAKETAAVLDFHDSVERQVADQMNKPWLKDDE